MPENRKNQVLEPIKNAKIAYENFKAFGTNYFRNIHLTVLFDIKCNIVFAVKYFLPPQSTHYSGFLDTMNAIIEQRLYWKEQSHKQNDRRISLKEAYTKLSTANIAMLTVIALVVTIIFNWINQNIKNKPEFVVFFFTLSIVLLLVFMATSIFLLLKANDGLGDNSLIDAFQQLNSLPR